MTPPRKGCVSGKSRTATRPAERFELKVPIGAQAVEVYADTQRVETRLSDRTVALPAFRTSCIVKLTFALTESQTPGSKILRIRISLSASRTVTRRV